METRYERNSNGRPLPCYVCDGQGRHCAVINGVFHRSVFCFDCRGTGKLLKIVMTAPRSAATEETNT